jgi:hypothetical protein
MKAHPVITALVFLLFGVALLCAVGATKPTRMTIVAPSEAARLP